MNLRHFFSEQWNCILRNNHDISIEDELQLFELGLGFYNTKCLRCGLDLRLETIKGDDDHYDVCFEPME